MKRIAVVEWRGNLKEGKGKISTESGALSEIPYSFGMRFENEKGTNPEELIAAAHAGCFSMALAGALEKDRFPAKSLKVEAQVSLAKSGDAWSIPNIHLSVDAEVPMISEEQFQQIADKTKETCPVSKVLNAKITLETRLNTQARVALGA
ncbi:MAG: OsmC family protein [Bdellovibrionales bacterium]